MTVVETKDLEKTYYVNSLPIQALRGISLAFSPGEFTAIAGPSGSGKTTLLHLVGCLDVPTGGSISVSGNDTARMSKKDLALLRRKTTGFIFQAYNLIPVLTAVENVSLPLVLLGLPPAEVKERSWNALAEVGLTGMETRRPREMSGGQQQRVAIARALVKEPSLVLADEPTANLDSITGREILELMLALNEREKTTFIFSTHDTLIMDYARRLIRLRDGLVEDEVYR